MNSAIVLAAGASSRMGALGPKALLTLPSGKSFVKAIVEKCQQNRVGEIIIVTRNENHAAISSHLPSGACATINQAAEQGMFSSVQCGIRALSAGSRRTLIWPVDTPCVTAQTIHFLLEHKGDVLVPTYQDRGGHPIVVDQSIYRAILTAATVTTLRDVIRATTLTRLPVQDDGVVFDVDTPQIYQLLQAGLTH